MKGAFQKRVKMSDATYLNLTRHREREADGVGGRRVSVAKQRMVVEGVGERGLDVRVHAPLLPPLGQGGPLQRRQVVQEFVPDGQADRVLYRQLRQLLHRRRCLFLRRFDALSHDVFGPFIMFHPRLVPPSCRKAILSHGALLLLSLHSGLLLRDELVAVAFLGDWDPAVVVRSQVLRRRKRRRRRLRRRVMVMVLLLLLRNLAFGGFCSAGSHPIINLGARQRKVGLNFISVIIRYCDYLGTRAK